MATALSAIIANVRENLNEPTASFWTDAKLVLHAANAAKDLWKAVKDTNQDYFFTVVETVSMAAGATSLSSVPTDVAEVRLIEPKLLTTYPGLVFKPLAYNHPDFQNARAVSSVDPGSLGCVYYAITGAGGPIGAPTIYVAPPVSSAILLRLMYVPVLDTSAWTTATTNPIPGESDHAIECWITAHALGKQSLDGTFEPDAGWLSKYQEEKAKVIVAVTPRQTQEPQIADAVFQPYWE